MAPPPITHGFPRVPSPLRWLAWLVLRAHGWDIDGEQPPVAKAVVIAAPHTSNWDFWYGLLGAWSFGIRWQWMGKDSLFAPPWGWLMRLLGGVSVDRRAPGGLVTAMADAIRAQQAAFVVVPAEGTRRAAPHWKSGFYWIALKADVPVVLAYTDFGRRRVGMGPCVHLTGDVARDMEVIRAFYAGVTAAHPERVGPVRLASETP